MCISRRLLEMSQEFETGWKEAVYQEREMVCLSRWFANALLAYSASSSGGHSTCFSSFSVFSFSFFAPVLRFIEELGFLWYIILPPKILYKHRTQTRAWD